jgi:hypothetical protein
LIELVGKYEREINQGGLEYLGRMLGELKEQFEKQYNTGSERWILPDANMNKLRDEMIKIIGSNANIQRIEESLKNLDLNNIFNSKQTGSKKETKTVEFVKEFKTKLKF